MNKKEIANELLLNSKNIYLKELIQSSLLYPEVIESDYYLEEDISRCYKCIFYIEKSGFDITGWKLNEIPIHEVYCFYNDKTDQSFDLVDYEGKILPSYILDYEQFKAESIREAIEKFSME